jgi:hypothetical protein
MNCRAKATLLALMWCLAQLYGSAQAPSDPWFRPSARPRDFVSAKLPWKAFTIELPKDWQLVAGHGGSLLAAAEKTRNNQPGGAIVVEVMRLEDVLTPKDIDTTVAGYELDLARRYDPSGEMFDQQVKDVDGRRFIFIQYSRPALNGLFRIARYSIPHGRVMYRLICIAPADQIVKKYQDMFAHVAWSFKLSEESD